MKLLNLKEEIKEILEELENMYEISELEEQVNNINKIRDYIINLQQENKKYKEVIDKAVLELASIDGGLSNSQLSDRICNLIDLLKEV